MGEEIGVVGSIRQLGRWDAQHAYKMTWTAGHIWVAEGIRINEALGDPAYFMYKYTILKNGEHQCYERGLDRIADLKLLKNKNPAANQEAGITMVDGKCSYAKNEGSKILYDEGVQYDNLYSRIGQNKIYSLAQ